MSFDATQKAEIRFYLGYQDQYREFSTRLESMLNGGLSAEAETLAIGVLADLAAVDESLVDARKRLKALKVGSIELTGFGEIDALRKEGRRFAVRLASMLGVPVNFDVFSDDEPSIGGNVIPLG